MARRDDEGPLARAGRQPVVAVHDERHAQPFAGGCGHELGTDGRSAHRQHDHGVDVAQPRRQVDRTGDLACRAELAREVGDLREHVVGVDAPERGRIVESDRLLEQRRPRVGLVGRIGRAGLLVRVLVSEVVARVHQLAAAGCGRPAPAMRRPSASSASTSSRARAST